MINPFYEQTEVLAPEDIADGVALHGHPPRHTAIGELWIMPTDQLCRSRCPTETTPPSATAPGPQDSRFNRVAALVVAGLFHAAGWRVLG